MTRVGVVGHVEWVDFLRVAHLPVRGEVQAARREMTHAGGGAVVAAAVLAELGAEVDFFCAVGRDADGDAAVGELESRGIRMHAARREAGTRQVLTLLDHDGERTIMTLGERLQPQGDDELDWERLRDADGVYVTAGDLGAVHRARAARVLVASPRLRERLDSREVRLDAVVFSAGDRDEVRWAQTLEPSTQLMVATDGAAGGRWSGASEGRWNAVPPPGPIRDSYGCGDAFAAGFTFGLASGMCPAEAAHVGARCGAAMLTRVGAP
ncbi:MAG TPA: PfkB family carbohydrate kinase [Solirubrobacteraceae bacterium]|nr:PfkB family carbohydrate kinase [Solirubrobacteraceae bacterium]